MKIRIKSLRREDGQALVELALVLPLLLFVLFAIIDFGEALNQYNDATNLANIGVRAAVVATSGSTNPTCGSSSTLTTYLQCEGALDSSALGNGLSVTACDTSNGGNWAQGDTIQVKVSSSFNWLHVLLGGIGNVGGLSNLNSTISSTATMREEASGNTGPPQWVGSICS